ncbi:MAG: fibronectin type III domain-containing protein [Acetobacter sp.]|nr:fibronectin type III domain-containing protein [Bacteroides sp.]MCM1340489.1 fibronectin type III domain-containing protein [Acetobacter sp.]MCM1433229.1 fibronectin type III domain-containing protein [Clostridiales bacterium]
MKKFFSYLKKSIAMLLVIIISICSLESAVYAFESSNNEIISFSGSYTNPLYNSNSFNDNEIIGSYINEIKYQNTADTKEKKEAATKIRDNMVARKSTFTININSPSQNYAALVSEIFKLAISKDFANSSAAGDYLAWHYKEYRYSGTAEITNGIYSYSFTFNISYYTTANQESKVTQAVNKALDSMNIKNLTTYEKIKNIYDYVCKVCNYDYSNSKDYKKFTAYGALIDGSAVCQGYSTLLYRMLEDAGIDNKIITSTDHSWNIVEIDGKYYNVDATWDDSNYDRGYEYSYFLKCPVHFENHNREPEYMTNAFNIRYNMTSECIFTASRARMRNCSDLESTEIIVPAVKSPALTPLSKGFTVKWTKTTGITGYQIQYATNNKFTENAKTITVSNNSTTSNSVSNLQNNKKYYVRIRAYKTVNGNTEYGEWSAASYVTTLAVPKTVTLKSVTAAAKKFTIKWNSVDGITGYQIQYATNNKFTQNTKTITVSKSKATSQSISNLKDNKKYYVRIRAYKTANSSTVYGNWSAASAVTTPAKPKAVALKKVTPASKKITVKWAKVTGITGYQIQHATNNKFTQNAKTITVSNSKTTSKSISKLKAKKKYYVRIRAYKKVNGTFVYGNWSKAKAVTTKK